MSIATQFKGSVGNIVSLGKKNRLDNIITFHQMKLWSQPYHYLKTRKSGRCCMPVTDIAMAMAIPLILGIDSINNKYSILPSCSQSGVDLLNQILKLFIHNSGSFRKLLRQTPEGQFCSTRYT